MWEVRRHIGLGHMNPPGRNALRGNSEFPSFAAAPEISWGLCRTPWATPPTAASWPCAPTAWPWILLACAMCIMHSKHYVFPLPIEWLSSTQDMSNTISSFITCQSCKNLKGSSTQLITLLQVTYWVEMGWGQGHLAQRGQKPP